jgi:antitoxin Phd
MEQQMSNYWQVQEAKAKFSRLMDRAMSHGPQFVTRHGRAAVVVLSATEYRKAEKREGSLVEFFQGSPLRGSRLELLRARDTGREVNL